MNIIRQRDYQIAQQELKYAMEELENNQFEKVKKIFNIDPLFKLKIIVVDYSSSSGGQKACRSRDQDVADV